MGIYCGLNEDFSNTENFDLDIYWKEKTRSLPNLSNLALDYIWLPVSDVDVEEAFPHIRTFLMITGIYFLKHPLQH